MPNKITKQLKLSLIQVIKMNKVTSKITMKIKKMIFSKITRTMMKISIMEMMNTLKIIVRRLIIKFSEDLMKMKLETHLITLKVDRSRTNRIIIHISMMINLLHKITSKIKIINKTVLINKRSQPNLMLKTYRTILIITTTRKILAWTTPTTSLTTAMKTPTLKGETLYQTVCLIDIYN